LAIITKGSTKRGEKSKGRQEGEITVLVRIVGNAKEVGGEKGLVRGKILCGVGPSIFNKGLGKQYVVTGRTRWKRGGGERSELGEEGSIKSAERSPIRNPKKKGG